MNYLNMLGKDIKEPVCVGPERTQFDYNEEAGTQLSECTGKVRQSSENGN